MAPAQQRMHITHLFNVSRFHHRYELYSTPLTVYVYIQMLGYLCHNCCIYLMSNGILCTPGTMYASLVLSISRQTTIVVKMLYYKLKRNVTIYKA